MRVDYTAATIATNAVSPMPFSGVPAGPEGFRLVTGDVGLLKKNYGNREMMPAPLFPERLRGWVKLAAGFPPGSNAMSRSGFFLSLSCLLAVALAGVACSPTTTTTTPAGSLPLLDTYWKLVQLGGEPVAESQREPHLLFAGDTSRATGSGGCNGIMGGFELKGDSLRLGQMVSTMMACPQGMEQEYQFLEALKTVVGYRVEGDRLALLDDGGVAVARFEAVNVRR